MLRIKIHILFLLFSTSLLLSYNIYAQAPESMNYQAVIRDGSGNVLASQTVGLRIKILQGSVSMLMWSSQTIFMVLLGLISLIAIKKEN